MIGVLKSLAATMGTMMRKPVTIQYPTQHRAVPERDRAFPILLWDFEIDEPFCTGCHACERACPVECMTVTMKDNPKFGDGSKRRKIIDEFFIDYGRCMRCNICVEVCNFDAIAMNNTWSGHELSTVDRKELVMDRDQLMVLSKTKNIESLGAFVTVAEIVFYLLALVAVVGAVGVVTVPNVVHAALFLILSLLAVAGFYILLSSEFLALVQILVYAGAIATIIIFGLMLTRGGTDMPTVPAGAQWPLALLFSGILGVCLLTAVLDSTWPRDAGMTTLVTINDLGGALFHDWLLPFEVASFVLLVALIGAVVISYQEEGEA